MTDLLSSPFGARSTAAEVVAEHDLTGQRVLVTGGYGGIGLETSRALATAGAHVVVAGRDLRRAGEVARELRGLGPGTHEPLELDLADPGSVDAAVEGLGHTALRAVVANAGVMACPLRRTAAGWEWQLGVNLLGHARLVWRLVPALRRHEGPTRVVMLTSTAHHIDRFHHEDPHFRERSYDPWLAYGQSKTADSLFAVALQASGVVDRLDAFAVHPGGILTDLQRHMPRQELRDRGWVDEDGTPNDAFKTPAQGASTQTWAAVDPALTGVGGRYLEDCAEAELVDDGRHRGVRSYAVDPDEAARLWTFCERELGMDAPA